MKKLRLKLSLSEQDDIKAEIIETPAGEPFVPGGRTETKKTDGFNYKDLKAHKNTLLKALEILSFEAQVFSAGEQDWLVEVRLLDNNKTQFLSLQKNIGHMLYQALFGSNEEAEAGLHAAHLKFNEERLHIQLVIHVGDERLVRLFDYPWELLHNGENFLTKRNMQISRYIAYDEPPPEMYLAGKLHVMLVSLNAYDKLMGLDEISTEEIDEVHRRLEDYDSIRLTKLTPSSFNEFGECLAKMNAHEMPHVIHFHGHGLFGKQCQRCNHIHADVKFNSCERCNSNDFSDPQGYLLFKDEKRWNDYISTTRLSAELRIANHKEGGKRQNHIALVVLSACQSGLVLSHPSIFNGIAQSLIDVGIPAVIGMQFSVTVTAAADFAMRFYAVLGKDASLFEAMANGLVAMNFDSNQWYRPVLYTRWLSNEDGRLFTRESSTNGKLTRDLPSNFWPSSGNFSIHVKELYTQVQENDIFLTTAKAVFDSETIWHDVCQKELEHLLVFSVSVHEFSSYIDKADIGKLSTNDNQLRSSLKKPTHDCKKLLDDLSLQVEGLIALLLNHTDDIDVLQVKKTEYLTTIRSKFTTLKKNLEQLHHIMDSSAL